MPAKPIQNVPGLSPGVLPDAPYDALTVGFKRKALEEVQAKQQAEKEKEKALSLKIDYKPVWEHGKEKTLNAYTSAHKNINDYVMAAQNSGMTDFNDPRNPFYAPIQNEIATFYQTAEKEIKDQKTYDDFMAVYTKDPNAFKPEFYQKVLEWTNDPNRGDFPEYEQYYDWVTGLDSHINALKDEEFKNEVLTNYGTYAKTEKGLKELRIRLGTMGYRKGNPQMGDKIVEEMRSLKQSDPAEYSRLEEETARVQQTIPEWSLADQFAYETQQGKETKGVQVDITRSAEIEKQARQLEWADVYIKNLAGIAGGNQELFDVPSGTDAKTDNGVALWKLKPNMVLGLTRAQTQAGEEPIKYKDVYYNPESGKFFLVKTGDKVENINDINESGITPIGKEGLFGELLPAAARTPAQGGLGIPAEDQAALLKKYGIEFRAGETKSITELAPAEEDYAQNYAALRNDLQSKVQQIKSNPGAAQAILNQWASRQQSMPGKKPIIRVSGGKPAEGMQPKLVEFKEPIFRITEGTAGGKKDIVVEVRDRTDPSKVHDVHIVDNNWDKLMGIMPPGETPTKPSGGLNLKLTGNIK